MSTPLTVVGGVATVSAVLDGGRLVRGEVKASFSIGKEAMAGIAKAYGILTEDAADARILGLEVRFDRRSLTGSDGGRELCIRKLVVDRDHLAGGKPRVTACVDHSTLNGVPSLEALTSLASACCSGEDGEVEEKFHDMQLLYVLDVPEFLLLAKTQ